MRKYHALWLAGLLTALVGCVLAQRTGYRFMSTMPACVGAGACSGPAASAGRRVSWALLLAAGALVGCGDWLHSRSLRPVRRPHLVPGAGFGLLMVASILWTGLLVGGGLLVVMFGTAQAVVAWAAVACHLMALLLGQVLGSSPRRARAQALAHLGMALLLPGVIAASWALTGAGMGVGLELPVLLCVLWPVLVAVVADRVLCRALSRGF